MKELTQLILEKMKMKNDPCWKGYKMIGMKKGKGGRPVPNCVPESVEVTERFISASSPSSSSVGKSQVVKSKNTKMQPIKPMTPKV